MGTTTLFTSCNLAWRRRHQPVVPFYNHFLTHSSKEGGILRPKAIADSKEYGCLDAEDEESSGYFRRRTVLFSGISFVSSAGLGFPREGSAVVKQGPLAGRIPGLSEPDEQDRLEDIQEAR
uniref:PsbP domain-containing protein 4ic n=1 Tax=Rhizophora mucronata TaxID=61149 RepID=A0A2P2L1F4_RHIMU